MCLFKAERRGAGLGRVELEWSTRDVANPQGPHKLKIPGRRSRFLVCHARNCGFLDF